MNKSNPSYAKTSALSLIAITAGTVSAALFIMFVGLFVTMLSLGSATQQEMQAAAITGDEWGHGVILVADTTSTDHVGKHAKKMKKGHFMDALLREENDKHSPVSAEPQAQPAPVARVFASSASTQWSSDAAHIIQI